MSRTYYPKSNQAQYRVPYMNLMDKHRGLMCIVLLDKEHVWLCAPSWIEWPDRYKSISWNPKSVNVIARTREIEEDPTDFFGWRQIDKLTLMIRTGESVNSIIKKWRAGDIHQYRWPCDEETDERLLKRWGVIV